jgi:molybdopterin molybdotransferase
MSDDVRMKGFRARTPVAEVEALIDARVAALGVERVPFHLALGRVLAEDVRADRDVPGFDKSAMDGYAVRAADLPGRLRVVGELMAADRHDGVLGAGEAIRIMTGARIPAGADCVVMVEDTRLDGEVVIIEAGAAAGQHVLCRGEDLREGAPILSAGRRLRPQDVSMLVMVGALEVEVRRRPHVRIVPTGSELVRVGERREGIVESNSFMLAALAERDGATAECHPIVRDDVELLRRALQAPGADLVVMTGGSSVGKEDLGPVVLRELGEVPVHGVHVKPASPTALGFLGSTPVLLAPGYPVAALVAWDLFGRRLVQRLAGAPARLPYSRTRGTLAGAITKPAGRVELVRVVIEDGRVTPLAGGAALLSTAVRADGFVLAEVGVAELAAGTEVDVHLYDR